MTYRPQRLKREPIGLKEPSVIRCPAHLQHVRGNVCCIAGKPGHVCAPGRSHAHHVQSWRAIEGGIGMKVGDDKTAPLCSTAHDEVHRIGQARFEMKWTVDLEIVADKNWTDSPAGRKYRRHLATASPQVGTSAEEKTGGEASDTRLSASTQNASFKE